jgi:hypothetical protein
VGASGRRKGRGDAGWVREWTWGVLGSVADGGDAFWHAEFFQHGDAFRRGVSIFFMDPDPEGSKSLLVYLLTHLYYFTCR